MLDPRPAVVFVTAHAKYALRTFEAHVADYMLKPVTRASTVVRAPLDPLSA